MSANTFIKKDMSKSEFTFFKLHTELFESPRFRGLSVSAKVLYCMMYSRVSLSALNNWTDSSGRVYIYFTINEIMEKLGCGHTTATKLLDELDIKKGAGLIERKKHGIGKPHRIFVKELCNSTIRNDTAPENEDNHIRNTDTINNNINNTDKDKNNIIISYPIISNEWNPQNTSVENITDEPCEYIPSDICDNEKISAADYCREVIKDNISYELAKDNFGESMTNQIIELMTEVMCTENETIRINKRDVPASDVRERFIKLNYTNIETVITTLRQTRTKINNIRSYIITALYRSYETNDLWWLAKAAHDTYTET